MVIALRALYLLFWYFISTTAYLWADTSLNLSLTVALPGLSMSLVPCPRLVVTGADSWSRGRDFESPHRTLYFFVFICTESFSWLKRLKEILVWPISKRYQSIFKQKSFSLFRSFKVNQSGGWNFIKFYQFCGDELSSFYWNQFYTLLCKSHNHCHFFIRKLEWNEMQ